MNVWDRRAVLAGGAALSAGWGAAKQALADAFTIPPPPRAKVAPATDVYFGESVVDPYRWMENDKDPDWLPYLKAQNDRTRAVLDAIPGHLSLDWWNASFDGAHVAYGLSKDGSEDSTLHVLKVADGSNLPEAIPQTQQARPQWLPDGSGFFYNQLVHPVGAPERFLDSLAKLHRLGTDPASDPVLMKIGLDPAITYERIQAPGIATFQGSPHVVLILSDVRPEFRAYTAPLAEVTAGRAKWREVAAFADEITDFEADGDDLYLVSTKGSPRGRLLKTTFVAPSLKTARLVVPEGETVIEGVAAARDGLYLRGLDGGISTLRKLSRAGAVTRIALPFDGSIGGITASRDHDGVLMGYGGWLTPSGIWSVSASGAVADTGLTPIPKIDVSAYETYRGFAAAKDGVKIPYTLIYKKGLKHDGSTPAWISAYGSYGAVAYAPSFASRTLALVDQGFIVGYANVRGGGEYGRAWHQAGQHANKPNTWRDLIAVCETLCKDGWTAPQRLAIGGRSAGGITMGMAMNERPDLFAAVIDGVGWSNPLRYVMEQESFTEEPEWGAITDRDGYKWLKAIDSYQHVKDGQAYPAVLLTTGVTDPRVAPFHVAKMTARLQAATSSSNPILLRVDYDAGHGIGSTRSQQDKEAVDTYAFLLWRTGVKGWSPV